MKRFSYHARAEGGMSLRGTITAESAPAAVRVLAAEGKVVLRIREQNGFHLPNVPRVHAGISAEERIAFLHELAALLEAGLPVHEALTHLRAGVSERSSYGRLIAALHAEVSRGMPLSQTMEVRPAAFPESLVGMVRAGEESGRLDTILQEAAAALTEAHVLRESLRSALAYPLFLLAATALSVLVMTVFVLPVFAALLRDLGTELPLPTRMLGISDLIAAQPYLVSAVAIGIAFAATLLLRVPSLRRYGDAFFLRMPVLGMFVKLSAWQMILRTLALLLRSGIRLDRAVGLVRSVTDNRAIVHHLARMEQSLVEGRTFAQIVLHEPYLPSILRGMLAAGEAAGDLERLLQHAADYCRRRAGAYAARIEALAEPLMIVLVGAVIFFVVLSVLLPIFDAMDAMM